MLSGTWSPYRQSFKRCTLKKKLIKNIYAFNKLGPQEFHTPLFAKAFRPPETKIPPVVTRVFAKKEKQLPKPLPEKLHPSLLRLQSKKTSRSILNNSKKNFKKKLPPAASDFSFFYKLENKEEQIIETRDKPQYLDIQRYLSYLQYPDATKSSTKDLSLPLFNLKSSWQ